MTALFNGAFLLLLVCVSIVTGLWLSARFSDDEHR